MATPFTVLLSVWAGDDAGHLREAVRSVVDEQTVRPAQLVLVQDGPVGVELARTIDDIRASSAVPVTFLEITENGGLGPALNAGLEQCWHDVVARMDADDISLPNRFEDQLALIVDADLIGAALYEFTGSPDNVVGLRVPPIGADAIAKFARVHDPFNHPTIMYRREAVVAAGGYPSLRLMEDYSLFARMIASGARVANLDKPLVYYRVGADAFKRRGGPALLRSEVALQRQFLSEGFVTRTQFVRNVAMRGAYRMIPWRLRRALYERFVPTRSRRSDAA
jgi:glycosyltransferase involved in cell wall biosynthesis